MKYKLCFLSTFLILFSISKNYSQKNLTNKTIILKMLDSIDAHNQIRFEMYRSERNQDGEYIEGKFNSKLQNKPYKIYAKMGSPKEGAEILYVEGENDNKALVNPNFFPYISLSFDPLGSLLKADGHHNIKEAGFNLFSKMIKNHIKRYDSSFFKLTTYEGIFSWNDRKCHKITINYKDYEIIDYTCKKGETLSEIAAKNLINLAKLRYLNPDINDGKKLNEYQTIKITSVYCEKSILFIDNKNYFPIYQLIYDEKGLFEKYIFTKLNLNTTISSKEFKRDYTEYDF